MVRIEDHDWVTRGEIADRIGRSRELVRLWAAGRHGPGGFPVPLNPGGRPALFSWVEIASWLRDRLGYDRDREEFG